MNRRQQHTLDMLFEQPTRSDVRWNAVESLFGALDAEIHQGAGSRVRVLLRGRLAVFHRPHPGPVLKKGLVDAIRTFLISVEVFP